MTPMIALEPQAVERSHRIMTLLGSLYAMELRGEAMFARMSESGARVSADQRRKLEACRLLAVQMGEMIWRHLALELGAAPDTTGGPHGGGGAGFSAGLAEAIGAGAWAARMTGVETVAAAMLPALRELKALYADRQPALCNTLLAQTLLIRDFAQQEAEAESDVSLSGVLCLLGAEGRRQLEDLSA